MVRVPYETIVERIKSEKGLSDAEILAKIKEKMNKLSGLISKEGAAYIIANELGIKLVSDSPKVKIKDVLIGMRNVETYGRVIRKFPVREFERNGGAGKVASVMLADETGQIRITCWNDQVESLNQVNEGDIIKIQNAYVKENNNQAEIHMNSQSKLQINPADVKLGDVKQPTAPASAPVSSRKKINELSEADSNVEIFGTVVQVFEPRFYAVCPQCNRKLAGAGETLQCPSHGDVSPKHSYVMNAYIDDGSDNIRAVFFREQAQALLKKSDDEIGVFRQTPAAFEPYKTALLGEQIKLSGKVQKNLMFERLELITSHVAMDINPEDEIKKLKEEFKPDTPSIDDI